MNILFEIHASRYPIEVQCERPNEVSSACQLGRKRPAGKKVNMASLYVTPRVRKLGRFFRKRSEANNNAHLVEVGDFRIDLDSRSVRIRDHELSLSSEEFDLLVFLAAHPRRIITPHTMLSTRCGDAPVHQVEMLPTLLSLRKKLQKVADGSRYIRTEPWVCYRFEPEAV
jgi:DNA-binding response OmpR family regulator